MDDIQLVMKVDTAPVDRAVRVMDNLEAELRDVERAMDRGLITERQFNAETRRLNSSLNQLKTAARGSAKDFRVFEKSVYGSGKAMRQKEIAMQQAGYQLQDFIVQVQAGTNPLIAFSQQGSQLAGFFAGPWGAAIGLGIAALGGLGTALLGTRNQAQSLQDTIDSAADSIKGWKDSVDLANEPTAKIGEQFGGLAKFVLEARQQVAEFRREIAQMRFDQALDKLMSEYVSQQGAGARGARIAGQFDLGREYFLSLKRETRTGVRREATNIVDQLAFLQGGEGREDPANQLSALNSIINSMQKLSEMKEGNKEAELEIIQHFMDQRDLIFQMNGLTQDQISTKQAGLNKLQQIQTDAMAMEAELAEEAKQAATDANTIRTALSSAYTLQRIADEEKIREIENDRLRAKSAMDAAALEATAQRAEEEYAAYQRGIDQRYEGEAALFDQAVKISDELLKKIEDDAEKAARAYENAFNASSFLFANRFADETALMAMDVSPAKTKTKKKSGRTPAQELNEYMKNLERTVKLEQKQVGVSEEVARTLELREEYEKRGLKVNESRIEALVAEEESLRKATEAEQKRQTMIDSFEGHIEGAFMALVDGSKSIEDTFKSMIRSIILDMYQQMVAKQAASFLMGFLPFANGGAFSGGRVTPFASGGVVNRPTLFPMANGAGLMGESGPEAIMPLKRGKDGKLGVEGGGGVTVVQNINVSTGVQQTVRTEIKSLMPQIAESAKSAVVDAKRRGGSYGRVFN